jgi:hypothetical protein
MPLGTGAIIGIVVAVIVVVAIILAVVFSDNHISGRYVIIERVAPSGADLNLINLDTVAVFGVDGASLTNGATVTAGSQYSPDFPASNLIDTVPRTFAHTAIVPGTDYTNDWFKIDLAADTKIAKVVITNRVDCCQARAVGLRVRITNAAGADVFVGPTIATVAPTYTFEVVKK